MQIVTKNEILDDQFFSYATKSIIKWVYTKPNEALIFDKKLSHFFSFK